MKIGIYGYGNLGRGVELAIRQNADAELFGVFTRRDPKTVKTLTGAPVYAAQDVENYAGEIDVMIICGGSASDLPEMTPMLAKSFNVVDSFDTHARVPEHFANVDRAALTHAHTAIISAGWDPGLFSLARLYMNTVLPDGKDYTFWGRGVSQGHSDAIRRIPGVKDARQYTVPVEDALEKVRNGENPEFITRDMHTRECYVVLEEGADPAAVEQAIVTMPTYFADYDTTVHFISEEELQRDHAGLPHGGFVIRSGVTGLNGTTKQVFEFSLNLESNPEFTSSVLAAYARAVARMNAGGESGCVSVFDIAPKYLCPLSEDEQRAHLL